MSRLSPNNPRQSLTSTLVTSGLGYCCEAWFWQWFAEVPSETVAIRLGVTMRTVQRRRALFNQGELKCQMKSKCFDQKVTPSGLDDSPKPIEQGRLGVSKGNTSG